jgi:serine/threonine-protein kinase
VFASSRDGVFNLYLKPADGSGETKRLTESKNDQFPDSWHPGGEYISFLEATAENGIDIRILELKGDERSGWTTREEVTFLSTPNYELLPQFSPDGNWLAYMSNESGRYEIYVRPFPGPGGKWQVSSEGGVFPRWSESSQQLYFENVYIENDRLYVSEYQVQEASFLADRPVEVPNGSFASRAYSNDFDPHPDGRILVRKHVTEFSGDDETDRLVLFQNFSDYLKQQVPVP